MPGTARPLHSHHRSRVEGGHGVALLTSGVLVVRFA